MTTSTQDNAISPNSVTQVHLIVEYERMSAEREAAMVPPVFKALTARTGPRPNAAGDPSRFEAAVGYLPLRVKRPFRPRKQPRPIVLPNLFAASVTTFLAPPYLYGSEEKIETAELTNPASYSCGHKEYGSVEVLAQVLGTDTDAKLYDDNTHRGRIAKGSILAGVYTVPATTSASPKVVITAPASANGTSVIYKEIPQLAAFAQLTARMEVVRVGGGSSAEFHLHTHLSPPMVETVQEIDAETELSAVIPVSEGDQLAIFLSAVARVYVENGGNALAVLNVASDGSLTNGGSVTFPYVEIRLV
jgi:hypothetical protein